MEQQHLVVTTMTTAAAKTTVIQRSSGREGNFDNKLILMSEVTKLFALKREVKDINQRFYGPGMFWR